MDQSRARLWTKDFVIVSSINFFITLIFYLLMVTLAIYAVNELDLLQVKPDSYRVFLLSGR